MPLLNQFMLFADYNKLMNQRIVESASRLTAADLTADRGAFFKSVLGTLNHILVGDIIWLKRFSSHAPSRQLLEYPALLDQPQSLDVLLFDSLDDFKTERARIDDILSNWMAGLEERNLENTLSYRNMAGKPQSKTLASLISHLFLHQVHHRGQITTLLSQSGVDFGETDILEIIDDYST